MSDLSGRSTVPPYSPACKIKILLIGIGVLIMLVLLGEFFWMTGLIKNVPSSGGPAGFTNPQAGDTWKRPTDRMVMVYVPEGEFTMGNDAGLALVECQKYRDICDLSMFLDEEPPHSVYLDAFWIDRTEVTNKMYGRCVAARKCEMPDKSRSDSRLRYYNNFKYGDYPVIYVSWYDAVAYCKWVGARLPTEAEWEKTARGTDGRFYPWGYFFNRVDRANFCDKSCTLDWRYRFFSDGYADTSPVGSFPSGASPYGALDMAGNVEEWVADWYSGTYYSTLQGVIRNPTGPSSGTARVLRGGNWVGYAHSVRAAERDWSEPWIPVSYIGFRCSRSAAVP